MKVRSRSGKLVESASLALKDSPTRLLFLVGIRPRILVVIASPSTEGRRNLRKRIKELAEPLTLLLHCYSFEGTKG